MAEVFYAHASETATVTNTFSVSGTATDPTTVSFIVTDPAGTVTTYTYAAAEITKSATGVYTKDIACPTAGRWQCVIVGTGTAADVTVTTWDAYATSTSQIYCTLEQLKNRMNVTSTTYDTDMLDAIHAASRDIDEWCQRHFWRTTATRTYAATDSYCLWPGDFVSITTLKTDAAGDGTFETTWSATDYQLGPVDSQYHAEVRPYTEVRAIASNTFPIAYSRIGRNDLVQIVGVFGWAAVPVAVRSAALILAEELVKLKDAPFGVAGFGEFGAVRVRQNPKAATLLNPYRRIPVLVG